VQHDTSPRGSTFRLVSVEDQCGIMIRELPAASHSYHVMKVKAHKSKSDQHDDDMWTWLVIGLIFGAVSLTLYAPLVWQMARASL
jgi:hypothetical protein